MKKLLMLLCALLMLPLCSQAVTTVPAGITAVGNEAFANTDMDALIIPAAVQTVGSNVLAGSNASYLYVQSAATVLASGANNGVDFVFAPKGSNAASFAGYYPTESLTVQGGLYYALGEKALPLCAKEPAETSGTLTIPKLVEGKPVTSLGTLCIVNTGVTEVKVPAYLSVPDGLNAVPYQTMTAAAPSPDKDAVSVGKTITWTTDASGAYGEVSYLWSFTLAGETTTLITADPMVQYAPHAAGTCVATVTVEDALGDREVSEQSANVTVSDKSTTYRALLIGNNYPGTSSALRGPENDLPAMRTMLGTMKTTHYSVRALQNQTADGILGAIASTFAAAEPGDVSLFYYGGHGTSSGSLVGTNNTQVTVYALRNALQKIPGTKIVILDCCYSGMVINRSGEAQENQNESTAAFTSAVISAFSSISRSAENLEDEGYIVLTACSKKEESFSVGENAASYFGVFTYGLCYGSGYDEWQRKHLGYMPADTNNDGAITLGEAHARITERISYIRGLTDGAVQQSSQYYGPSSFVLWQK